MISGAASIQWVGKMTDASHGDLIQSDPAASDLIKSLVGLA